MGCFMYLGYASLLFWKAWLAKLIIPACGVIVQEGRVVASQLWREPANKYDPAQSATTHYIYIYIYVYIYIYICIIIS